ncbi:MAG: endo alpha-1,4 polygalactosaminidase [Chloroflexi bacterium HGW-Chloroflexi-10]|nr:MAG: endo alpha-1,4 polygalactosaminidase [Chloroflexi bacterium HGW-Chloroflexi-10]
MKTWKFSLIFLLTLSACGLENTPNSLNSTQIVQPVQTLSSSNSKIRLPKSETTFSIQFSDEIDINSLKGTLIDLDLFETDSQTITSLHNQGKYIVCYLSAGSWENWRPDASEFPHEVIGSNYAGWPGEKWLDIRELETLAPILTQRLDLCAQKGFDGVEPDNVDGYQNNTGFPLSAADQLQFNRWLAAEAHARGLSIGLKNDPEQAADLVDHFDWALLEDCYAQNWCNLLDIFINQEKAVFAIEYTDEQTDFEQVCRLAAKDRINVVLKNRNLDSFEDHCP